ncbi:MAG: toprim domain-containing protein, partial [Proteobacteria bacterium]|nr:toprim domain-containing protein [Pseudomonadota bacterium]
FYDRFRNRVMFPIVGLTGRVIAFGGRILDDGQPKYMNSPESPVFDKSRTLFGLYQNRDYIRQAKSCLVVEGNFDLLSLVVHGVRNVVAPLGTALTQAHIRSLKGYTDEVILLFDGDQAGLKAAMRSVPLFLSEQVTAKNRRAARGP